MKKYLTDEAVKTIHAQVDAEVFAQDKERFPSEMTSWCTSRAAAALPQTPTGPIENEICQTKYRRWQQHAREYALGYAEHGDEYRHAMPGADSQMYGENRTIYKKGEICDLFEHIAAEIKMRKEEKSEKKIKELVGQMISAQLWTAATANYSANELAEWANRRWPSDDIHPADKPQREPIADKWSELCQAQSRRAASESCNSNNTNTLRR